MGSLLLLLSMALSYGVAKRWATGKIWIDCMLPLALTGVSVSVLKLTHQLVVLGQSSWLERGVGVLVTGLVLYYIAIGAHQNHDDKGELYGDALEMTRKEEAVRANYMATALLLLLAVALLLTHKELSDFGAKRPGGKEQALSPSVKTFLWYVEIFFLSCVNVYKKNPTIGVVKEPKN